MFSSTSAPASAWARGGPSEYQMSSQTLTPMRTPEPVEGPRRRRNRIRVSPETKYRFSSNTA